MSTDQISRQYANISTTAIIQAVYSYICEQFQPDGAGGKKFMVIFLSMILAFLAAHLFNGWAEHFMGISLRAMLDLIIFIVVYMICSRYLKSFKN